MYVDLYINILRIKINLLSRHEVYKFLNLTPCLKILTSHTYFGNHIHCIIINV